MPTEAEEIAEIVRQVMADEEAERERRKHVIPDGGVLYVRRMMMDSLDPVQRSVLFDDQQQPLTLDALIQGREAWRREQAAELQAILDGTGTPAYGAALMKRQEAWEKRGEIQSQAWRTARSSAVTDNAGSDAPSIPQPNASLADAEAAREAAWQRRGERQANAWKR